MDGDGRPQLFVQELTLAKLGHSDQHINTFRDGVDEMIAEGKPQ
jgi:hypothetical protein